MKRIPKIILLIESSHSYGRGLLRGISRYADLHGPWTFLRQTPHYIDRRSEKELYSQLKHLHADAMIIREPADAENIIRLGLPAVVSPIRISPKLPAIVPDTPSITKLAAHHLLEIGLRHFAFVGFQNLVWSQDRRDNFKKNITEAGFKSVYFELTAPLNVFSPPKELELLIDWLNSLPKPVGIMACNDDCGLHVLEACRMARIHVPEQVAVIGVDNDELTCNMATPPLSSVALPSEKIGFEAAALLDKIMHGEKMKGQIILHQPTHVVTRLSTDVVASDDKDVAQAVRFIRQHCNENIQVGYVAESLNLSRRNLHAKFAKTLGHSVGKEIVKTKTDLITKLLMETDWPISKISQQLGFLETAHMSRYFSKVKGISPALYRKKYG